MVLGSLYWVRDRRRWVVRPRRYSGRLVPPPLPTFLSTHSFPVVLSVYPYIDFRGFHMARIKLIRIFLFCMLHAVQFWLDPLDELPQVYLQIVCSDAVNTSIVRKHEDLWNRTSKSLFVCCSRTVHSADTQREILVLLPAFIPTISAGDNKPVVNINCWFLIDQLAYSKISRFELRY